MNDNMFLFLEIKPSPSKYDRNTLKQCIFPYDLYQPVANDPNPCVKEKIALKEKGFKNPVGLFGYSHNAEYKDLYIYFDSKDNTSPINYAATKAFKCYGMDGAQHVMDWEVIRGSAIVLRSEPSNICDQNLGNKIEINDLIETLMYFIDKDAHEVAIKRDSVRMMKYTQKHEMAKINELGMPSCYIAPGISSTGSTIIKGKKVMKYMEECNYCHTNASIAGGLFLCSKCKTTKYCGKDCQRLDWKSHKLNCNSQ